MRLDFREEDIDDERGSDRSIEKIRNGKWDSMTQERLSDADEGRTYPDVRRFLLQRGSLPGEEPQVRNDLREHDADQRQPIR